MVNWFVAFPVPEPRLIPGEVPANVRAHDSSDLHITTVFLGPVAENLACAVFADLEETLPPPMDVSFGSSQWLGSRKRPSSLVFPLDRGKGAIRTLILDHRSRAARVLGLDVEDREPLPHVTVARVGSKVPTERWREIRAWGEGIAAPSLDVHLVELALFRTAPKWSGQRYEVFVRSALR